MPPFRILFVDADDALFAPFCAWFGANAAPEWAEVSSAGVKASDGGPVGPRAVEISTELGFDLASHTTVSATPERLTAADLILTRCWDNVAALMPLVPNHANEIFTLKEWLHWARQTPVGKHVIPPGPGRAKLRVEGVHLSRRKARAEHGFWAGLNNSDIDFPQPDPSKPQTWQVWINALRAAAADAVSLVEGTAVAVDR